jgi:hypothetical protein
VDPPDPFHYPRRAPRRCQRLLVHSRRGRRGYVLIEGPRIAPPTEAQRPAVVAIVTNILVDAVLRDLRRDTR